MKNMLMLIGFISISFVAVAQKKHLIKAVAKPIIVTPSDPVLLSFNQKFSETTFIDRAN